LIVGLAATGAYYVVPVADRDHHLGRGRILALAAAALVAPVTLLIQNVRHQLHEVPIIATARAVLFALTV
jgi:hypothetical protein